MGNSCFRVTQIITVALIFYCRIFQLSSVFGMETILSTLYASLEKAPEDWSVRLRLIEMAVARGDLHEAKRLVRSSPDEGRPLPAELRERIHILLTGRG